MLPPTLTPRMIAFKSCVSFPLSHIPSLIYFSVYKKSKMCSLVMAVKHFSFESQPLYFKVMFHYRNIMSVKNILQLTLFLLSFAADSIFFKKWHCSVIWHSFCYTINVTCQLLDMAFHLFSNQNIWYISKFYAVMCPTRRTVSDTGDFPKELWIC